MFLRQKGDKRRRIKRNWDGKYKSSQYREELNGKKKKAKTKVNHLLKGRIENKDNCIKEKNSHLSQECQRIKADLPEETTLSVLNLVNYVEQRNGILLTQTG